MCADVDGCGGREAGEAGVSEEGVEGCVNRCGGICWEAASRVGLASFGRCGKTTVGLEKEKEGTADCGAEGDTWHSSSRGKQECTGVTFEI